MINYTAATQDDGPITPYRQGFLDYVFGKFLWENPYQSTGDSEIDTGDYYDWYDGWNGARSQYPHLQKKRTSK